MGSEYLAFIFGTEKADMPVKNEFEWLLICLDVTVTKMCESRCLIKKIYGT